MFKGLIYFLFTLITIWWQVSYAQEKLHLNHFTTQDGLPSNTIYVILEDKKGFLWIGTEFGVARYDGVSFKTFTAQDGLTDNTVLDIIEDNQGRIWFFHFASTPTFYEKGKIYNKNNNLFLRLLELSKLRMPPQSYQDLKTNRLFFPLRKENDSLSLYSIDGFQQNNIEITIDATGIKPNHFFHANKHLYILKSMGAILTHEKNTSTIPTSGYFMAKSNPNNPKIYFTNLKEQKTGWFDLKTGEHIQKGISAKTISYGSYSQRVYTVYKSELSIWSKNLDTLLERYEIVDGVENVFESQNGQVWMSGHRGLYMLTRQFTRNLVQTNSNRVAFNSIYENNGVFVTGSNNQGVYMMNQGRQKILITDKGTDRIHGFVNYDGRLLFGADGGIYEIIGDKIILLLQESIKDIELDNNGGVLFSTAGGVLRFRDNTFENLYHDRTTSVFQFDASTIWFGTLSGLHEIKEGENLQINKIASNTKLDFSNIKDIKSDQNGNVWIATHLDGLFMYNQQLGFVSLHTENCNVPIPTNICLKIFIDENQLVWLATAKGITKIRKAGDSFLVENFSQADGIVREDIHDLWVKDENLYLATSNGCFVTKITKPSTFNSDAFIEHIWMNGREIDKDKISFSHNENNFTFSLAASFMSAVNNKYHFKYLLEDSGSGSDWLDLYSDEINLLNLNPGSYTLRVKPYSPQGGEAGEVHWTFTIMRAWYNQWWFYTLCVLFSTLIVIYFVSREANRIKNSRNLSRMELKVLRAQMNPHFIFNALNSIQHQLFSKDFKSANTFIARFAKLLRSNLHYSAQEFIDVLEEIAFLTNYLELEKYRFENLFDFELELKNFDENDTFKLPPFMIQPLVENCVKHAFKNIQQGGKIKIVFSKIDDALIEITCEDNGKGLPKNFTIQKSKNIGDSVGLGIIAERIKILSEQHKSKKLVFKIENRSDEQGTKARLILPITGV
jgi:TRAP-type C4-dicarboxylate transport system permease small subunit